jgi:glycosyltransferase involved in cell wall biosynthesis
MNEISLDSGILRGRHILVLSPSEWGDNAVSNMQIAALLSETNEVLYIETMGGRFPRITEYRRVLRRLKSFFTVIPVEGKNKGLDARNVTIYSPICIPLHGLRLISWFNTLVLTWQVRRAMKRMEMQRPIIWSFSPRWQPVIQKLDHNFLIFHCVDGLHTYDASEAFKSQYERSVRDADVVFTPGVLLERELRVLNKSTYRVGHGSGGRHLIQSDICETPPDIAGIAEPRAVYAGTLANWVDYSLLIDAAQRLPNVSFVLIGYIHALAPIKKVELLISLPNVHHIGFKNYNDLPHYYGSSAVGLVPYQADNEHIQYCTPTKFLDYFAAGIPIVSTCFPAAESMGGLVKCAVSNEDFISSIVQAVACNPKEEIQKRLEFAKSNSWELQLARMSRHIVEQLDE